MKRKDANGNREITYHTVIRKYKPTTHNKDRRKQAIEIINKVKQDNPTMKAGKVYKLYVDECNKSGISEDDIYTLGSFYGLFKGCKPVSISEPINWTQESN